MTANSTDTPKAGVLRRIFRQEASPGRLAFGMNLPSMIIFAIILAYPIFFAGYLSFHDVGVRELRDADDIVL